MTYSELEDLYLEACEQRDAAEKLASQINTDWIPANKRLAAERDSALRELAAFRGFAHAIMEAWPECGVDGGELQDIAVAHGLLRAESRVVPCGEVCQCAEVEPSGEEVTCYRATELLLAANA